MRGRRRGTLCARPSAAAPVPRLRRPVDPPSRPRWVRPPAPAPPAAAASSLPPRSLATPPAAHARTHLLPHPRQDGRAVDAGQQGEARPVVPAPLQPPRRTSVVATSAVTCEATATAGCRLGPALAAPPLARHRTRRGRRSRVPPSATRNLPAECWTRYGNGNFNAEKNVRLPRSPWRKTPGRRASRHFSANRQHLKLCRKTTMFRKAKKKIKTIRKRPPTLPTATSWRMLGRRGEARQCEFVSVSARRDDNAVVIDGEKSKRGVIDVKNAWKFFFLVPFCPDFRF